MPTHWSPLPSLVSSICATAPLPCPCLEYPKCLWERLPHFTSLSSNGGQIGFLFISPYTDTQKKNQKNWGYIHANIKIFFFWVSRKCHASTLTWHFFRPSCCTVWALRAHCMHLPGNSPKITCHLSASTAKQQSPPDNNQHMRWHMGPRTIRGVANLAPNTKLGEVQQDANRFVKGGPIAPSKYCDSHCTHGILTAMYTRETSAGYHSIAAQRHVSPTPTTTSCRG